MQKDLDRKFSRYIRLRDGHCVICGSVENLQCGHYLSRRFTSIRYDFRNCNCQCAGCNIYHNQNPEPYRAVMVEKYGEAVIAELHTKAKSGQKVNRQDYTLIGQRIGQLMALLGE